MNTAGFGAMILALLRLASAVPLEASLMSERAAIPAMGDHDINAENLRRLYRVTTPLLRAMDHALGPRQVSIGIVADSAINAANGGGGKFFVTTGLLAHSDDQLLRAVMAHEVAHEDLGHVASLKLSGSGTNMILLEELAAERTAIIPFAGPLNPVNYSPSEESAADRQSIAIVERAGFDRKVMLDALSWAAKNSPRSAAFHPGQQRLDQRIKGLRSLP
jgi:predicted Zn-dependent protease